jgi:hypothetical protein
MKQGSHKWSAAMLAFMAAPAVAEAPAPAAATGCELHVFPTTTVVSQTEGLLAVSAGGNRKRNAIDTGALLNAIDVETQGSILGASDMASRLGLPPAKIVVEPAEGETITTHKGWKPPTACYYEFRLGFIGVSKSTLFGSSYMVVLFKLWDYSGGRRFPKQFPKQIQQPIKLFPPKPGEDLTAANAEVVTTFKTLLDKFAEASRTKMSKAAGQN